MSTKRYYEKNKEAIKRRAKAWALAHPERRKEIRIKSALKHREKKRLQSVEYARRKRREDPDKAKEDNRRWAHIRRTRELGNGGFINAESWQALLDLIETKVCVYCGDGPCDLVMDHFVPVKLGGRTEAGNLLAVCSPCNNAKRSADPAIWVVNKCGKAGYDDIVRFLSITKEALNPHVEHRET